MVYGKINGFEERKDSFVTSPNDVYFVYMDGAYLSHTLNFSNSLFLLFTFENR